MKCPDCQSERISNFNQELVCEQCGLVIEDKLIEKNEFLTEGHFAEQPYLSIAGTNIEGKVVKNAWLMSTRQKNLISAKSKIELLSSKFNIPKFVTSEACVIYKSAVEKNLNIGRDNESFVYASVYTACLIHHIPKTPQELTAFTNTSPKDLLRAHTLIFRELNLKIKPTDPVDLVPRFGSRLRLKQETITRAMNIIHENRSKVSGKHPKTIAAAAIYLATKLENDFRPQREITNATGVIEVTLRKRSREMRLNF